MKTTDFIRMELERSAKEALALDEGMKDASLTLPTSNGCDHPLWIMGHIAVAEGKVIREIMLGDSNPLAHWMGIFGFGSQPVADSSRYPAFDEVSETFREIRSRTIEILSSVTEEDLDEPGKACPPPFHRVVGTVGKCFQQIILHPMYHAGQASDARRMAGRKPRFG
jgi:hypothetical protein